ncbi:MAG: hypothetical protein ACYCRM_11755 [Candidatus Dormibacteria bacterium]
MSWRQLRWPRLAGTRQMSIPASALRDTNKTSGLPGWPGGAVGVGVAEN